MGLYTIRVPDIGEGIAEVELVAWHVQPGDSVTADQPLADVMTDKATVEIPAPVAGTVLACGGEVGQTLAVGSELLRLEVEGAGNLKGSTGQDAAPVSEAAPAPVAAPVSASARPTVAPVAASSAEKVAANTTTTLPGAPGPAPAPHANVSQHTGDRHPLAAPAVRRRALDLGIALREVPGSGPDGRIGHADLDAYLQTRMPAPGSPAAARPAAYAERQGEAAVPVIGLRRKIALKMQESKQRIPHFSYVEEIDVTELEALRARLNLLHAAKRGKLTLLPFLVRAMVLALRDFPQINARFDDGAGVLTQHAAVHLGIATQTPLGLMVPVLRHAEALDLWACAAGIARLAEDARSGRAVRETLSGSTITLTSLGALGGIASTPIINHPEVAIVGVNRIVERPMLHSGSVVARQLMNLSSSFDHRVVDGLHAAEFIQGLRTLLETPALLFVD